MKKFVVIVAVLMSASFAGASTMKIAVVDMQKAVQSTESGKKAKKDLESEFEKKKKELQARENDLKKMGEDIEKKKSVLSEEALMKRQGEFQEEMMKYREVVGKSQMDLQKKERDLTQPILDKMRRVIEKVAKDKGYDMVLENNAMVLFAAKGHDLTDDVIKAFEKEK